MIIELVTASVAAEVKVTLYAKESNFLEIRMHSRDYVTGITAVMNRKNRLLDGLRNWLECPAVKEIVVVDWSSTDMDPDEPASVERSRVRIVRVEGQEHWCLAQAFNLAARYASESTLC